MAYTFTPPPISWPVEVQALVASGYRCRNCRTAVVADDERRVVLVNDRAPPELSNIAVLCQRCAQHHR